MTSRNWISEIDNTTKDFNASFGDLSMEQLNWKPDPSTWSIAQNIDHLITTNESYYPVIRSVREGNYKLPFVGKIGILVNLFGKMILKGVQPDRKMRSKTFPIWQPATSDIDAGILDRFVRHQEQLKKMIIDSEDLIRHGTIISSPANRNIVYKLENAFDIIVSHEQRHLAQAREVQGIMPLETT